jgi:hypothetical protein
MRTPENFDQNDSALEPFVIAADSPSLDAACEVLFIHGNDLTWGDIGFGLFLVHVNTDENFDEVTEVAEARSKLSFASVVEPLLKPLEPRLVRVVADVTNQLQEPTDKERDTIIGKAIVGEFANETTRTELSRLASEVFGVDQWMSFANAIASGLLRSAISLRERQLSCTGKSHDDYDGMLYALQRLNLCHRMVRVAYPDDSLNLEIAVAPQGEFRAIGAINNSNVIEWLRIKEDIAALKRGQDRSLPLFIARFINRHYAGPRQAFACVLYGEKSEPDLDVAIPALELGFEVKLYQSPFSQTSNKLPNIARDLAKQLPAYVKAGCKRVVYLCNLSQEAAESVGKMAFDLMSEKIEIIPVGDGVGNLLSLMEEIGRDLQSVRQNIFEAKVQRQASAAGQQNQS